jgi:hypothetical protein
MNERQRADQLAQAIDELIHGTRTPEPAQADDELKSLIAVARARLDASRGAENRDVQESVWQRVLSRLDVRPQARREVSQEIVADDAMRETIVARREMSDAILDLAEQHREDVWERVQQRIGRGPRRKPSGAVGTGGKTDDPPQRARFFPTGDEDLDSLLSSALNPPTLRDMAGRETDGSRRLHDRMRNDPAKNPRQPPAA